MRTRVHTRTHTRCTHDKRESGKRGCIKKYAAWGSFLEVSPLNWVLGVIRLGRVFPQRGRWGGQRGLFGHKAAGETSALLEKEWDGELGSK